MQSDVFHREMQRKYFVFIRAGERLKYSGIMQIMKVTMKGAAISL